MALLNKLYANLSRHHKIVLRPPFGAYLNGMSCRARGYVQLLHASLGRSLHGQLHPFPLYYRVLDTQYHLGSHPLRQHLQQPSRPFGLNTTYTLLRLALHRLYRQTILLINNRWLWLQGIPLSVRHSPRPLLHRYFAGLLPVLISTLLVPWNSAKSYARPLRLNKSVRLLKLYLSLLSLVGFVDQSRSHTTQYRFSIHYIQE